MGVLKVYDGTTFQEVPIVSDHGALTGLSDDDHTEYLLIDGTRAMTGDLSFSQDNPEILGGDTDGVLIISPDTANNQGGSVRLYGNTHASLAKDIEFYSDTTLKLSWDDSEGNWDFDGENIKGVGTFAGAGTVTIGVDDTGHDVKFFGASAGAFCLYDESADTLEIRGASADAAASSGKLKLVTAQTAVEDGDILGRIDFQAPLEGSGTDAVLVGASIWAEADDTFAADNNATELVFATGASETATEKMRLTTEGYLGINIATPSRELHVVQSSQSLFDNYGGGAAGVLYRKANGTVDTPLIVTAGNTMGIMRVQGYTGSAFQLVANFQMRCQSIDGSNNLSGNYRFRCADTSGTLQNRMWIDEDGGIGMGGNESPSALLHVDQGDSSGGRPVLLLDQADVDEDYFKFIGTSDTNVDRALVDAADFTTPGSIAGWLKINIQDDQVTNPIADGDFYIPFYSAPSA